MKLNHQETTIEIGDKFTLLARLNNTKPDDLQFSSSNTDVVTVDENGVVVGENVGSAEITVKAAKAKAKCKITVIQGEKLPVLLFENISNVDETITIYDSDSVDLSTEIKLGYNYYDDAEISYDVVDETVGKVENGTFIPNSLGTAKTMETKVIVTAKWRDFNSKLLVKEVTVKVIERTLDVSYFMINERNFLEDVELYSIDVLEGETYQTEQAFHYELYRNGEKQTDLTGVSLKVNSIDSDYHVAKVENNTIKALAGGRAEILLSYVVDGVELAKLNTVVNVSTPYAENGLQTEDFSAIDGVTLPQELFGDDTVIRAVQNIGKESEKELEIIDGELHGLDTVNTGKTVTGVTLFTKTYGYTVEFSGYTKILTTKDDLRIFELIDAPDNTIDGYYYLANDIDATTDWEMKTSTIDWAGCKGFIGTFDGNGKTIHFKWIRRCGLFQKLGENSIVKNLGITVTRLRGSNTNEEVNYYLFGDMQCNTTLSNIAVTYIPEEGDDVYENLNLFSYKCYHKNTIKDVYIYVADTVRINEEKARGLIAGYYWEPTRSIAGASNIQIVSKNLKLLGSVRNLYAENESKEVIGKDGTTVDGFFRYDDVATLRQSVTKVGNWQINADGSFAWAN